VAGSWLRLVVAAVAVVRLTRWTRWPGWLAVSLAVVLVVLAASLPALRSRALRWRAGSAERVGSRHRFALAPRGAAITGGVAAALLAAWALGSSVERYQAGRLRETPAALALERLTAPHGTRAAYVGYNAPYLFFGTRLQNDIRIVPRSLNPVAEFYGWGISPRRPQPPGIYSRWRALLEHLAVQYVVVVRGADEDPERRWMANHWDAFHRVYTTDSVEIWQVVNGPATPLSRRSSGRPRAAVSTPGPLPKAPLPPLARAPSRPVVASAASSGVAHPAACATARSRRG
jgi:hypothetical protein